MARQRSAFPRARSQRRSVAWGLGPGGNVNTPLAASGSAILGSGVTLVAEEKATIVRIRGNAQVFLSGATSAIDGFHCALGLGICTNDAFAIGVTAVPDPIESADWDGWMYHRFFDIHSSLGGLTEGEAMYGSTVFQWEVDTKAMRKFQENMTLFAIVEVTETGVANFNMFFDSRVLIKLT